MSRLNDLAKPQPITWERVSAISTYFPFCDLVFDQDGTFEYAGSHLFLERKRALVENQVIFPGRSDRNRAFPVSEAGTRS